jgi:hypothetical protein
MRFQELTEGIRVATVLHPDESARSEQSKRGIQMKRRLAELRTMSNDKTPGYKLRRRQLLLLPVIVAYEKGLGPRPLERVFRRFGVKKSTIKDWIDWWEN